MIVYLKIMILLYYDILYIILYSIYYEEYTFLMHPIHVKKSVIRCYTPHV